jgi:hypothetical protein
MRPLAIQPAFKEVSHQPLFKPEIIMNNTEIQQDYCLHGIRGEENLDGEKDTNKILDSAFTNIRKRKLTRA